MAHGKELDRKTGINNRRRLHRLALSSKFDVLLCPLALRCVDRNEILKG